LVNARAQNGPRLPDLIGLLKATPGPGVDAARTMSGKQVILRFENNRRC
jgi:hypothetical protein